MSLETLNFRNHSNPEGLLGTKSTNKYTLHVYLRVLVLSFCTCLLVWAKTAPTPSTDRPLYPSGQASQRYPGAVLTHFTPGKQGLNWHCGAGRATRTGSISCLKSLKRRKDICFSYLIEFGSTFNIAAVLIREGKTQQRQTRPFSTHIQMLYVESKRAALLTPVQPNALQLLHRREPSAKGPIQEHLDSR